MHILTFSSISDSLLSCASVSDGRVEDIGRATTAVVAAAVAAVAALAVAVECALLQCTCNPPTLFVAVLVKYLLNIV